MSLIDKEKLSAYQKAWYEKNKDRVRAKQKERNYQQRYGLSTDEATAMRDARSGCDICGGPPDGPYAKYAIDHNHTTGQVRGCLCYVCNHAVGRFKDSPMLLIRAAEYLSYYEEIADGSEIQRPEVVG